MGRGLSLLALAFASSLVFSMDCDAAEVTKVKGRNVLVNLSGESAQAGDTFYLLNSAGKKKAIIKITKVKGDQAIAHVSAGAAEVGMSLQRRMGGGGGGAGGGGRVASRSSGGGSHKQQSYWGLMGGLSMNNMQVDLPSTPPQTVTLTGMGFSAEGFFDYKLFEHVWFRGLAGYQGFSGTGPDTCAPGNQTCNVNISYLGITFLGRYLFTDGDFRPWLGGGFSLLFPATKSSTALDPGSINNSGIFVFTGGADWSISPDMYIPFSVEYALFPKSATVGASWFAVRAGIAWPF